MFEQKKQYIGERYLKLVLWVWVGAVGVCGGGATAWTCADAIRLSTAYDLLLENFHSSYVVEMMKVHGAEGAMTLFLLSNIGSPVSQSFLLALILLQNCVLLDVCTIVAAYYQ